MVIITDDKTDVWEIFSDRVTIAGVEDLHRAEGRHSRVLFMIGLILSSVFGVITSIGIVQQYWNEKMPVEIIFKDDGEIPFPNVTICTTAVNNVTAARELLVIPQEVEKKLKALRVNMDDFLKDTLKFTSLSLMPRHTNQSYMRYIDAVMTATARSISGGEGGRNVFDVMFYTLPSCPQTLSNCVYGGIPFNCCEHVVLGANDGFVCYGIPVSRANHDLLITSKPITFNVDVRMDWRHIPFVRGDDALDGFIVIIGQPYTSMNDAPVAVAPGWHGVIKLTQVRRRMDYTNCVQNNALPTMRYTTYYDPDGKLCELDKSVGAIHDVYQCTTPAANYFPNASDGCNFMQGYFCMLGVSGQLEGAIEAQGVGSAIEERMSDYAGGNGDRSNAVDFVSEVHDQISGLTKRYRSMLGSFSKQCKPRCEGWQYEPIVGYSELLNKDGTSSMDSDTSWSRITVTIPSSYYEEHVEGSRTSLYVVMCSVGGTLGVCLGLSAVTIIQVIFYGFHTGYLFWKKRTRRLSSEH